MLDRAVAEIILLAGFRVGYVPVERGRKIVAATLAWGRKDMYRHKKSWTVRVSAAQRAVMPKSY